MSIYLISYKMECTIKLKRSVNSERIRDEMDRKQRNGVPKKIITILCICMVLFGFFWYENHHLVVTTYTYQDEKVDDNLAGYRIVQISDLHNAKFGQDNKNLLVKISELQPDMIVITGDLVDSNHTNIHTSIDFVKQAVRISDVYYVTGNHEYWLTNQERIELLEGIENAGAVVLSNESVDISYGGSEFTLIGLEDNSLADDTLNALVKEVSDDQLCVLLAHEPQYYMNYANAGVDMVFSGHAHGGQFILPFIGPLVAPDQGFCPQFTSGEHHEKETTMYISRGLGNSIIPVRLFNNPEIVCVDF